MFEDSGYVGPLQTKACVMTEVRSNIHCADDEPWTLRGDGTYVDPKHLKISDKSYAEITKFYAPTKPQQPECPNLNVDVDLSNPAARLEFTQSLALTQAHGHNKAITFVAKCLSPISQATDQSLATIEIVDEDEDEEIGNTAANEGARADSAVTGVAGMEGGLATAIVASDSIHLPLENELLSKPLQTKKPTSLISSIRQQQQRYQVAILQKTKR
ncbi:hypothetical protein SARC_03648 [Sphaeroforma arctica JP610]|uniref:Uncharacterized protein n=1 Tax=Sphaeroforma arctica JP610 TaxID=667725 RepID=A0A0L0G517_9EUKA|nr:hypothetical protein SARC_03648 [Sphaeroforma arctica JP610]KNC84127.1 hypothetical protein SARC_03648 [Sphaeroforma arctica JP610]|eukprot:XP_014158029.1 hypothetical protein SARC_03648 [Sphaeroforma arctica JP610]